ncbi:hypothetical protein Acr_17g0002200 [Actinidia rufa]|uniref:Uncharacterized protein n=1 Tax=Actinidia rufa TaxID=165716 RepID=A0A7J0G1I7_9ERIC|nr:hypothetical protein Acr_17g0002200 [Actinidia rufa]
MSDSSDPLLWGKMDEVVKYVDVSSFMFFEVTGDSEASCELNEEAYEIDVAEDDAQSCSCDLMDFEDVGHTNDEDYHVDDDDDEEEEEEEEEEVQDWSGGDEVVVTSGTGGGGSCKKRRICVESSSTIESMNEMEKSRLFWRLVWHLESVFVVCFLSAFVCWSFV